MRTKIKISPKLVLSISTLYEALIRVILELVDNSLDSCENIYKLIQGKMKYAYFINISIIKKGGNYKEGKIIISDNCLGIINLGNIFKDDLSSLKDNKLCNEMIRGFKNNKKVHELCKKCKFL